MEVPTTEVGAVERHTIRPRVVLAGVLLALALPVAIFGAVLVIGVWGYEAASPTDLFSSSSGDEATEAPAAPDPDTPDGQSPEEWKKTVLVRRYGGYACLLTALGMAIVARKQFKKKRFFIMAKTVKRMMKIEAKDEVQQTQIMVTIGAIKGKNLK
jgi:hypothetical protein